MYNSFNYPAYGYGYTGYSQGPQPQVLHPQLHNTVPGVQQV